jgi:hypothetical protein
MIRPLISSLIPLFLLTSALPAAKPPFPPSLDAFLGPAAKDEVRSVSAATSLGNTRYYIILRSFEFEAGEMLLSETGGKVTVLGADSSVFPLSRFKKLPPEAATALADAYVRKEIAERGKPEIQKELRDPDAAKFLPPDLMAAYRRAGIAP